MKGGALFNDPYANYTMDTGVNSGVVQYLYYFIVLTIIILLVLVLVHYTIMPIFRTRPGSKGIIPLPGSDDSSLYWKDSNSLQILKDTQTQLGTSFQNYSAMLDIQIDNPTSNTNYPRVLFLRGDVLNLPSSYTDQDTILKVSPNFNLIVYLDRITNDLNIATQTVSVGGGQILVENITIPNIPVGKSVRLGAMLGSKVLEIYINGYLVKSRTFTNPLRSTVGQIQPPSDQILSSTARVKNLRLWNRPLTPAEFRSYGSADGFDRKDIPDSCLS